MAQHTIGHQMDPFDLDGGGNWCRYSERLEQYFVANGIQEDTKKVAVLLCMMGEKPYELVHNLLAPAKLSSKKYQKIVDAMTEHLQPKPHIIAKHFKFYKRNQGSSETVSQYLAELRRFADKCEFQGYLDEALHNHFICGLHSKVIQRRLLGEEELSLKKALKITHGMKIANLKASKFHTSVESKVSDDIMMIPSAKTPCYRCNKVGHSPDSCYFRKQKCRSCGKIGHIAKACQAADNKHTAGSKKPENKRTRQKDTVSMVTESTTESEPDDVSLLAIQSPGNKTDSRIKVQLEIQGVKMTMELDTGASVSIISSRVYRENLSEFPCRNQILH